MPTYRDTYQYYFKMGNKIVHVGITYNPDFSEAELKQMPGLGKGHIKEIGFRTTYDIANAWLQEQIRQGKPRLEGVA
ncbi:MAG: GIY-YIG nuclease family protein [Gammaproteobacteria bacterium]|nr:GIY-YIG nuclease family protein [Gammaproteobacteria bacterium]